LRKIQKNRQDILGDSFSLFGSEPAMPRRELSRPKQIVDWLEEWGKALSEPASVLQEFSQGWETRASRRSYGNLTVIVPAPADLLVPKLKRGEPRDRAHAEWAKQLGMV
jgi:hypothetical protein